MACAIVLSVAVEAAADPLSNPKELPLNKREALRRAEEGTVAFRKADFEGARLRFLQALALDPDATQLLWNLAISEVKTHHGVEALHHFRRYLSSASVSDADRVKARGYMETAGRETGHVTVTATAGTALSIDGTLVGEPLSEPIDVEPGSHRLEAHWQTQSKTVNVSPQAGETLEVDLRMPEPAPKPSVALPVPISPPAPEPAVLPPVSAPEDGHSGMTRVVVTSAFGAGAVAAVVTGILLRSSAGSNGDRAVALGAGSRDSACTGASSATCAARYDAASSEMSQTNASTAFFVSSGALAGAAVASWFLFAPKPAEPTATRIVPLASPTSAGWMVSGAF